ncbi:hypothetical protein K438DRAFT_2022894 [Mycena galopus ATCC 62051]|nr:hypothetical protein K438DRAFT_1990944 [Mycena galopus ATCC 62051]KAF8175465.1 hypothetical protein K438DRAFT_2022894 [Mycena galopus ATCC 62051]
MDTRGVERNLEEELDSIVYPVLSLLPEITSHIFFQSLPEDTRPSPRSAPLLPVQICRSWRIIALATPDLWQSIKFSQRWLSTRQPKDPGQLLRVVRSLCFSLFKDIVYDTPTRIRGCSWALNLGPIAASPPPPFSSVRPAANNPNSERVGGGTR